MTDKKENDNQDITDQDLYNSGWMKSMSGEDRWIMEKSFMRPVSREDAILIKRSVDKWQSDDNCR
jgi:hypothetical protein